MLVAVFITPKMLPDNPETALGNVTARKMQEKEPLSPMREVLGYGVFIAVIIGLMAGAPLLADHSGWCCGSCNFRRSDREGSDR